MGDPQYVAGLPYDVGTCEAGGVSILSSYPQLSVQLTLVLSLTPVLVASRAQVHQKSSPTATQRTRTVAMATTQAPTMATAQSMGIRHSSLSRANLRDDPLGLVSVTAAATTEFHNDLSIANLLRRIMKTFYEQLPKFNLLIEQEC